ncbi:hypothetical protein ABZV67_37685 [Streptomyces sp. NPDC005065]|uniref:hypothetical protein n=1 Tax=Streptomyces sp. NPDC005065 TaxID=3154461 RepID=UPI0033BC7F84
MAEPSDELIEGACFSGRAGSEPYTEERAIDAGRNQCAILMDGDEKADWLAAQRFGSDSRPLTDAQRKQLNAALRETLCPE